VDATTIFVIALAVLFFGGMGTLVIIMNTPPKKTRADDASEGTKQKT
jgi:hypothetical protein